MANLIDIQLKIEELQKQANQIRTKEFDSTVAEIRAKMSAYGITVKDLVATEKKRTVKVKVAIKKASKNPKVASKVAAKFKGPNGEEWTGRGLTPKWLATLVAQGRTKGEFAVGNAAEVALTPPTAEIAVDTSVADLA